jgi:hypothetical protein
MRIASRRKSADGAEILGTIRARNDTVAALLRRPYDFGVGDRRPAQRLRERLNVPPVSRIVLRPVTFR